jgi:protein PhnA
MEKEYTCPECNSPYGYPQGILIICPECGHEWSERAKGSEEETLDSMVRDANGNPLVDGDDVTVIKDLPVKGAPKPIKAGTKVKNIKLKEGDHNIDCKIKGFGAMALKSEFVKKVN